ncbi:hypothetical protein RUND412_008821 [Rhizina undulata]
MEPANEPVYIPPPTSGHFWDIEEARHQESLHRVFHAEYLRRHRNDSKEARKLYYDFLREQDEWAAEQQELRYKEEELALVMYRERLERWNREWKEIESGKRVEDILKDSGATPLILPVMMPGGWDQDLRNSEYLSTTFAEASTSYPNLDLPPPLVQPTSTIQKEFPKARVSPAIGQIDGAEASKLEIGAGFQRADMQRFPSYLKYPAESSKARTAGEGADDFVSFADRVKPPTAAHTREFSRTEGISIDGQNSESPLIPEQYSPISTESNFSNKLPIIVSYPPILQKPNNSSLAGGKVQEIIGHRKCGNNGRYLYSILWKSKDGTVPPVEWWVKTSDLQDYKLAVEEYHIKHKLGPVRWPRDYRLRISRSSGCMGVKEIKTALEERKKELIERGLYDEEASRELTEERWRMRNEWQHRGRGWGVAQEVVQERKRSWRAADKNVQESSPSALSGIISINVGKGNENGVNDGAATPAPEALGRVRSHPLLKTISVSLPKSSPSDAGSAGSESGTNEAHGGLFLPGVTSTGKTKKRFTPADEAEWRKHFLTPELVIDDPRGKEMAKDKDKMKFPSLSRVSSTIRDPGPFLKRSNSAISPSRVSRISRKLSLHSFKGMSRRTSRKTSLTSLRSESEGFPEAPARPSTPERESNDAAGGRINGATGKQGSNIFSRILSKISGKKNSRNSLATTQNVRPQHPPEGTTPSPASSLPAECDQRRALENYMENNEQSDLSEDFRDTGSSAISRQLSQKRVEKHVTPSASAYLSYDGAAESSQRNKRNKEAAKRVRQPKLTTCDETPNSVDSEDTIIIPNLKGKVSAVSLPGLAFTHILASRSVGILPDVPQLSPFIHGTDGAGCSAESEQLNRAMAGEESPVPSPKRSKTFVTARSTQTDLSISTISSEGSGVQPTCVCPSPCCNWRCAEVEEEVKRRVGADIEQRELKRRERRRQHMLEGTRKFQEAARKANAWWLFRQDARAHSETALAKAEVKPEEKQVKDVDILQRKSRRNSGMHRSNRHHHQQKHKSERATMPRDKVKQKATRTVRKEEKLRQEKIELENDRYFQITRIPEVGRSKEEQQEMETLTWNRIVRRLKEDKKIETL